MPTDDVIEHPTLPPRERIVLTAREMFRQRGVKGVGVEAITDAAGTNKMTLYRHFDSKDDLIVECLRRAVAEGRATWDRLEAEHADPSQRLDAWVRLCATHINGDCNGCEMVQAAIELTDPDHPARRVIEDFKQEGRRRLVGWCRDAGLTDADYVADMLTLLLEGARVNRQSAGDEGPHVRFTRMARAIIDFHDR